MNDRRQPRAGYPLARPPLWSLDSFASRAGVHPDLLRRLVALGLVEASRDTAGQLWFGSGQLSSIARVQRLRAGLSLNYAAIGVVVDLLDRIALLEAALRRAGHADPEGVPSGRTRVRPSVQPRKE